MSVDQQLRLLTNQSCDEVMNHTSCLLERNHTLAATFYILSPGMKGNSNDVWFVTPRRIEPCEIVFLWAVKKKNDFLSGEVLLISMQTVLSQSCRLSEVCLSPTVIPSGVEDINGLF